MTTKYGVFSEPDYLGPGGIHSKIAAASAGGDGSGDEEAAAAYPPFKFRAQKKGKNNDALFSPVLMLTEPSRPREIRPAQAGAIFRPAGQWRPGSHSDSNAPSQPPAPPPRKKGDIAHEPRGMIATPHHQGHWGAPGTTLGKFEHVALPAAAVTAEQKARQEQDHKLVPFKSAVRPKHGISGAMSDYNWEPKPAALAAAEQTADEPADKAVPFKPVGGSSKPFSKYPEHQAAPAPVRGRTTEGEEPKLHSKAWVHTASNHSDATRSIVRMNIH